MTTASIPGNAYQGCLENTVPEQPEWVLSGEYPRATAEYRRKGEYWLPDTLADSGRIRNHRHGFALHSLQRLTAMYGALVSGVMELPQLAGRRLYSKGTINAARSIAVSFFRERDVQGLWKLEWGEKVGLHLHLVFPASADLTGLRSVEEVDDVEGLARYLCKPADARACRPPPRPEHARLTRVELEERQAQAAEQYLKQRKPGERFRFMGTTLPDAYSLRVTVQATALQDPPRQQESYSSPESTNPPGASVSTGDKPPLQG